MMVAPTMVSGATPTTLGHREPEGDLLSVLIRETPRLEASRATMLRGRVESSDGETTGEG